MLIGKVLLTANFFALKECGEESDAKRGRKGYDNSRWRKENVEAMYQHIRFPFN